MQDFGGGGVDKVHNGLCENGELNSGFNNSPLSFKYLQPQSQEKSELY